MTHGARRRLAWQLTEGLADCVPPAWELPDVHEQPPSRLSEYTNITVTFNGQEIHGFAEGDFVEITNSDHISAPFQVQAVSPKLSGQGTVSFSLIAQGPTLPEPVWDAIAAAGAGSQAWQLQHDVLEALQTTEQVPYTDAGITVLEGVVSATVAKAAEAGQLVAIAPPDPPQCRCVALPPEPWRWWCCDDPWTVDERCLWCGQDHAMMWCHAIGIGEQNMRRPMPIEFVRLPDLAMIRLVVHLHALWAATPPPTRHRRRRRRVMEEWCRAAQDAIEARGTAAVVALDAWTVGDRDAARTILANAEPDPSVDGT